MAQWPSKVFGKHADALLQGQKHCLQNLSKLLLRIVNVLCVNHMFLDVPGRGSGYGIMI